MSASHRCGLPPDSAPSRARPRPRSAATAVHSRRRCPALAFSRVSKAYCSHSRRCSSYVGGPTNQPSGFASWISFQAASRSVTPGWYGSAPDQTTGRVVDRGFIPEHHGRPNAPNRRLDRALDNRLYQLGSDGSADRGDRCNRPAPRGSGLPEALRRDPRGRPPGPRIVEPQAGRDRLERPVNELEHLGLDRLEVEGPA